VLLYLTLAGWALLEESLRARRVRPRRRQLATAGHMRGAAVPALLRRIQVEEAELTRVLGDPYRAYESQTKRLLPGLW
jgi:protein-S-isoprenylcysteine O-methyltransferase Ste14